MEYTLHKDFSSIPAAEWNALASESTANTPFSRYEYLSHWWSTLGGGEWKQAELVLISASEEGKLTGIAPLFKAEHDGRSALLLVGSIEISDYLDLIVRPADLDRFITGLIDFLLHTELYAGLPIDWYNLPDSSPSRTALKAEADRRGWSYTEEIYRPTPHISLNGSFEAYLAGIDKKQRHEIRRKMRRAAESEIPVRFYVLEDRQALESEMGAFFDLMVQDSRKSDFLTPAMRAHLLELARTAFDQGYLWLAFLTIDGIKAAAAFNFDYQNKLWGYNSGVSRDFMELSPGWVLLGHQLEWACDHGRTEFDFMRGDEEYKYRFGAVNRHVLRVTVIQKS